MPCTPQQIEPARAKTHVDADQLEQYQNGKWVIEEKFDGSRYLLHFCDGHMHLTSRRRSVVNNLFVERTDNVPHITNVETSFVGTVLDGEIMTVDGSSVTSIMGSSSEKAILRQKQHGLVQYFAFDIIKCQGKDVRGLPASQRRELLEYFVQSLPDQLKKHIVVPKQYKSNFRQVYDQIVASGGEGVIVKKLDAAYANWIKVKKVITFDVVVTGFTQGTGQFANTLGAVVFSAYRNHKLVECGQCSGMDVATRYKIGNNKEKYIGQVIEVAGQEISKHGRIRHPRFIRFRTDKNPEDCKI